jgi:hypothetical protein
VQIGQGRCRDASRKGRGIRTVLSVQHEIKVDQFGFFQVWLFAKEHV